MADRYKVCHLTMMFLPGTEVRIAKHDNDHTGAANAVPTVGMIGKVPKTKSYRTTNVPLGKTCVMFSAKSLGYSGREPIYLYWKTDYLEKTKDV